MMRPSYELSRDELERALLDAYLQIRDLELELRIARSTTDFYVQRCNMLESEASK